MRFIAVGALALALVLSLAACNSILGIGPPGTSAPGDGGTDGAPGVTIEFGTLSSVGPAGAVPANSLQVVEASFEVGATVCNGTTCLTGGLTP